MRQCVDNVNNIERTEWVRKHVFLLKLHGIFSLATFYFSHLFILSFSSNRETKWTGTGFIQTPVGSLTKHKSLHVKSTDSEYTWLSWNQSVLTSFQKSLREALAGSLEKCRDCIHFCYIHCGTPSSASVTFEFGQKAPTFHCALHSFLTFSQPDYTQVFTLASVSQSKWSSC